MLLMENHQTDLVNVSPHSEIAQGADGSSRPINQKKKNQQRTCIVSRETHEQHELLRFVCDKDGTLFFDRNNKLPGRGMYVLPARQYLETAIQKNLFSKAAKRQIIIPDNFLTQIEANLRGSALDHINLARRSSDILYNFDKINKFIKSNSLGCYITCSSQDSDGYRQLARKLSENETPIITLFNSEDLNKTLGLEKVAHVAFKATPLCRKFLNLCHKINHLKEMKA